MKTIKENAVRMVTVLLACALLPISALAQEADPVPFVDGDMWEASIREEKISYIVGLSNLLDAEYAFQKKSGNPPSDEQSFIRTLWENVDHLTLDECVDRIDRWYEDNPNDMDRVVLDVIWDDMVEPNL